MITLDEKISDAEATLQLAADMSKHYYNQPLIVCYSGGKDSDVLLDIAVRCLKPTEFEVLNAHTTVDAPDTVYHIREVFKRVSELGVKTTIQYPTYNGEPISMWKLIPLKKIPPTRKVRYCCEVLKEASTPNRVAALGVREDESSNRQGRDAFAVRPQTRDKQEWRSLSHTYAMYQLDLRGGEYECAIIKACKDNKDLLVNPIYKFTEKDIWEYVKRFDLPMNPLYSKGYKRVGCVGCPLGSSKHMKKEFKDFPKYKENYIKAFDRMLKNRNGKPFLKDDLKTGEDVMKWWLGEDPKQITFDDMLKDTQEMLERLRGEEDGKC